MSSSRDLPRSTASPPRTRLERPVELLVVCTGNAARSVMAGYMLERLGTRDGIGLRVTTGGTHALDGQPMSMRTGKALASLRELDGVPLGRHRSRQVADGDFVQADLVVAMEAGHVRYVRRQHPEAAARTATLVRLCRDLDPGPGPLPARVAALHLDSVELGPDEDVADPAGGDDATYVRCAAGLWRLCQELVARI